MLTITILAVKPVPFVIITLFELIDSLKSNTSDFSKIDGLIWRKNGEVIENKDRPYICDLDGLPFPERGKNLQEKTLAFYIPELYNINL